MTGQRQQDLMVINRRKHSRPVCADSSVTLHLQGELHSFPPGIRRGPHVQGSQDLLQGKFRQFFLDCKDGFRGKGQRLRGK